MIKHGYSAYSGGKCRCDTCCEAARVYRAAQRARRLASGEIEHGLRAAYDCGCRCLECTDRHNDAHRLYSAQVKAGDR